MRELQYPGTDYLEFFRPALLGYTHGVTGQETEARLILADCVRDASRASTSRRRISPPFHVGLGERNAALDWLELPRYVRRRASSCCCVG
jgi:hypothetical protein